MGSRNWTEFSLPSSHLPSVENRGEGVPGVDKNTADVGDSNTDPRLLAGGPNNRPRGSYLCPRCKAAYCELPVECSVCGITLMSAPHLARAYHHLFPLPPFVPVPREQLPPISDDKPLGCGGCNANLKRKVVVSSSVRRFGIAWSQSRGGFLSGFGYFHRWKGRG